MSKPKSSKNYSHVTEDDIFNIIRDEELTVDEQLRSIKQLIDSDCSDTTIEK